MSPGTLENRVPFVLHEGPERVASVRRDEDRIVLE
jgi:hypothetical protein